MRGDGGTYSEIWAVTDFDALTDDKFYVGGQNVEALSYDSLLLSFSLFVSGVLVRGSYTVACI